MMCLNKFYVNVSGKQKKNYLDPPSIHDNLLFTANLESYFKNKSYLKFEFLIIFIPKIRRKF